MWNPFGRLDVWILQKCNLAYLRQFLICCSTAVQSHEAVRASLALFVRWRRVRGAANVQLDQWLPSSSKWLQEYPKRGPLTMHRHGLNGNALQHQAVAHTLTYGGSSTTNFHHLLQFQGKEWWTGHSENPAVTVRPLLVDYLTTGLCNLKRVFWFSFLPFYFSRSGLVYH